MVSSLFLIKSFFIILIIILCVSAFSIRKKLKNTQQLIIADSLTSGIFIGLALFHILPEASEALDIYVVIALCLFGFFFLIAADKLLHWLPSVRTTRLEVPLFVVLLISLHAFIAGATVGVSLTLQTALLIMIAILMHKGFETFAVTSLLYQTQLNNVRILQLMIFFILMTPVGILIGEFTQFFLTDQSSILLENFFNAFASGTFLYIGCFHSFHHTYPKDNKKKTQINFIAIALGMSMMALVSRWI